MSQVCNNPIITFMSIVIISCDTTQVLYITRYCVYIYKDMTRHGATIRHIRKKLFSEKEKGKRKNYDQCSHITQNFPRPFLNQPNLKPYLGLFQFRVSYLDKFKKWSKNLRSLVYKSFQNNDMRTSFFFTYKFPYAKRHGTSTLHVNIPRS